MTALLQRDRKTADDITPTGNDADAFLRFFDELIKAVRAATSGHNPSAVTEASLSAVRRPVVTHQVMYARPHTDFLIKGVGRRTSTIRAITNASLREGRLPTSQKHAVVTPL